MMQIYYDGDCPFCSSYIKMIRLRERVGPVRLINLREDQGGRERFALEGIDLDKGMVVEYKGEVFHGARAIHLLARQSMPVGMFGYFNLVAFYFRWIAVFLYPIFRLCRNATLIILSRSTLRAAGQDDRSLFILFCWGWGVFSCLHAIVYMTKFSLGEGVFWGSVVYPSTWMMLVIAFFLLLFPEEKRLFIILTLVMAIDAFLQAPMYSNHTIIKNFFLLAVMVCGTYHALKGNSWQQFFNDLVPVGRSLLALMYVFGVWHKINAGFLDPDVSCAKALWEKMPLFLSVIDHNVIYYAGIYGTLILETVILVSLLVSRVRWFGITVGILFHSFLALSQYAFYSPFSMLSVALHLLFLSPKSAASILQSKQWEVMVKKPLWVRFIIYGVWFGVIYWLASYGLYTAAAVIWLLGMSGFFVIVCRHAKGHDNGGWRSMLFSPLLIANVVTGMFFFNCITPYLGLKTAQSINMFANLRLEGGVSNHLVLSAPPGPFKYLEDIVELTDSGGSQKLRYIQQENLRLVYYDLLAELEDNPRAWASYIRDGRRFERQDAQSLATEIDKLLHPKWFRKWFHFSPVDLTTPKPCGPNR